MGRMRFVPLALCMIGCATSGPAPEGSTPVAPWQYEAALDPVIAPSWLQALRAYVTETCTRMHSDVGAAGKGGGDPPASHHVNAGGGVTVQQGCGLVYFEVFASEHIQRFSRDVCRLRDDEKLNEDCSRRFIDMFFARLSERYDAADWSAVDRHCRAYPLECNEALKIERQLVASHNAGVRAWYASASQLAIAQARYQAAEVARAEAQQQELSARRSAERRRNFFLGLSAVAGALTPPPSLRCTSNSFGTSTYTNCR